MAYQALLFCPEEKAARTVTQVLSELEFNVEPCTEPFAAVKKLMSQHFDAIVVDCDNEQNATLLFKSARNSTSNQASLAVAIVEGQAGVAKAFRIGANLVLTKPINVEQSKGTLRVARGLLRKGEPVKPAGATTVTAAIPVPGPIKPAAPKPLPPAKPEAPAAAAAATPAAPRPATPPVVKPAIAAPVAPVGAAAAVAKTAPTIPSELLPGKIAESPAAAAAAAPVAPSKPAPPPQASVPAPASVPAVKPADVSPAPPPKRPMFVAAPEGPAGMFSHGAASAPAPAREAEPSQVTEAAPAITPNAPHQAENLFEKPAETTGVTEPGASIPAQDEPAPSFTFGGANVPERSSGAGKNLLVIAAVILLAASAYFAWNYFQAGPNPSRPAFSNPPLVSVGNGVQPASRPAVPAPAKPSAAPAINSVPDTKPAATNAEPPTASVSNEIAAAEASSTVPSTTQTSVPAPGTAKSLPTVKPAAAPLVVPGGSAPVVHRAVPASDTAAPSLVGIATAGSDGALSNIVGGNRAPQPVLQTVNISQGVSQGLIQKRVLPIYPRSALAMHVEGAVELMATISKSGAITGVKVLKGNAQLSESAVAAVKQWKYKPYLLNGEPVEIQTQITVNFKLPR
jgi:protein TonB